MRAIPNWGRSKTAEETIPASHDLLQWMLPLLPPLPESGLALWLAFNKAK